MSNVTKIAEDLYHRMLVFTEGYGFRAKLSLIPNAICRASAFIVGAIKYILEILVDKSLPSVMIKNKNGVFKCRKGSSDVFVASERYERGLTNYLGKSQIGVFVDIGANIGKYTIKVAKQIGDKGKVVAIEADPENYQALIENLKLNKLSNVYAFNMACWSKEEDIQFFISPIKSKGESSIKLGISDRVVTVHGNTLDNILKDLGIKKVDMVKMDVEGAEAEVLLGMKDTVFNSSNIEILFEAMNKKYLGECSRVLDGYGLTVDSEEIDNRIYRARKA